MALCPTCNHDAEIGARFCSICGTALPRRMCLACGMANDIEAFRCIECGEALRLAAPAPEPAVEPAPAHELGPMARLAALSMRAGPAPLAPAPSPAASLPAAQPAAATTALPVQAPPAAAAAMAAAAPAVPAATHVSPAPSPTPGFPFTTMSPTPSQPAPQTTPASAGPDEAEAVDLYLELPRSGAAARGDTSGLLPVAEMPAAAASSPSTAMPGPTLQVDVPFEPLPPAAAAAAAATIGPHRLMRLAPYAIGLAAVGLGIVISGDGWLTSRSSPAREATAPPARGAQDPPPPRPGVPGRDDVRPAGQPLPSALPSQATRPPDRTSTATGTSAPRGPGVDAAADAALAAAERALAAPARQPSTSPVPAARPRAAAAPASSASAPLPGTATGR